MRETMATITSADGTRIAFQRLGDGPPIILAGGSLADHRFYAPLARELAEHFTVYNFDHRFLPLRAGVGERWKRVDLAFYRDVNLPPVSLYKPGDAYFVLDGNHRVSVARFHGLPALDADVVEFLPARDVADPGPETRAA